MKISRFFGTFFITLGVLNIANFWAPRPIPTVGPSAFLLGFLLIGVGLFLRAERDSTGHIRWGSLKALFRKEKRKEDIEASPMDPLLPVKALKVASQRGGRISIAQLAMELNVSLEIAEKALDTCVRKGSAFIEIDQTTGITVYCFPEFMKREDSSPQLLPP
ncbi:MAG: hypothetical protein N2Z76_07415 [Treponemataceae bacterium]|nr:hypothetical protein [Treponemataceae bacterium]